MDRVEVWPGQVPQDTDILNTNRYSMVGLGIALQSLLGTTTFVDGLACAPASALTVNVGPGAIYGQAAVDATAYGSLAADTTDLIVKQGLTWGQTNLVLGAPSTAGQSVVWLIEAQFQEVDSGSTSLPYYNSANPAQALWTSNNTVRKGVCALQAKRGTPAVTGSQVAPAADSGWTPLYNVTVAYGASSISAGNIAVNASAPFISIKIGQLKALAAMGLGAMLVNDGSGNLTLNLGQELQNIASALRLKLADNSLKTAAGGVSVQLADASLKAAAGGISTQLADNSLKTTASGVAVQLADNSVRVGASGLQGQAQISHINASQSITAAHNSVNFVGTAPLSLSLAQASTLWNGFYFSMSAQGGPVAVVPYAGDTINGAPTFTLGAGATAMLARDDNGAWTVVPWAAATGGPDFQIAFQTGQIQ